jgi:hypothetical protein
MATSILEYIFCELAISYLDRGDPAHVQPGDLLPRRGRQSEAESTLPDPDDEERSEVAAMMQHGASSGYVRSKLTVSPTPSRRRRGRTTRTNSASSASAPLGSRVTG